MNPHKDRDSYQKTMTPIFAVMCFTEGCAVKAPRPFVNEHGQAVASNSTDKLPALSREAMDILHGRPLGNFIKPPEETFICLIIAKYLAWYFTTNSEENYDLTEFKKENDSGNRVLPIAPWKGSGTSGWEQVDYDFFWRNIQKVMSDYHTDKVKEMQDRWCVFNFPKPSTTEINDEEDDEDGNGSGNEGTNGTDKSTTKDTVTLFEF